MVKQVPSVAIVGAGITGLTCGRVLRDHGIKPVLFDKGRGLGGRVATRRASAGEKSGYQFDHGAPCVDSGDTAFAAILHEAQAAGAAGEWSKTPGAEDYIGLPGMTGLSKFMAQDLDIRKEVQIERIYQSDAGWHLTSAQMDAVFDRVVVSTPAPQTIALLPQGHALADQIKAVEMVPCLTLMLGWPEPVEIADVAHDSATPEIEHILLDSAKPGRPADVTCVVAHASAAWSARHIERSFDEIAEAMTPLVLPHLGAVGAPSYVSAHRWRYARASRPLGAPFLADADEGVFIGGDWCLGAHASHAWMSGDAIGRAIVGSSPR